MFCIIIESNSKTFSSIVLYTNMAAVTSGKNHLHLSFSSFEQNAALFPQSTRQLVLSQLELNPVLPAWYSDAQATEIIG